MESNEGRYKIIGDAAALEDFINWLPECEKHERFYCCLFSRKKYVPEDKKDDHPWIKSDKSQLSRFISRKERLFSDIWQREAPLGAYQYGTGKPAIPECLALYININPRDLWKSNMEAIKKLLTVIESQGKTANPEDEVMSIVQQTCSNKRTILFDIDSKEIQIKDLVDAADGCCDIIETRGGYHVHVWRSLIPQIKDKAGWYKKLSAISDVQGDEMSPVVGCYQGGFIPKFVYRHDKFV